MLKSIIILTKIKLPFLLDIFINYIKTLQIPTHMVYSTNVLSYNTNKEPWIVFFYLNAKITIVRFVLLMFYQPLQFKLLTENTGIIIHTFLL